MNRKFNCIYVVIFCVIILTPSLVFFFNEMVLKRGVDFYTLENEQRELTAWPDMKTFEGGFEDYAGQLNAYVEDRLVFRSRALALVRKARFKLFGIESSEDTVIGKDGWLFYKPSISSAIGLTNATVSDEQLHEWADNALKIKQGVERNGGRFIVVIPPDKTHVYPEYFNQQIRYDSDMRLVNRLKPILLSNGIEVIDLLNELLTNKKRTPERLLYSKTDTHWTHKGALIAYQSIISKLNSSGLDLKAVGENDLTRSYRDNFSGDLSKLLGLSDVFSESLEMIEAKSSFDTFRPTKRLLIYGDSFYDRMEHYWRYSFKTVKCVHHNIGQPNISIIDKANADVVIFEMIERNLVSPLRLDGTEIKPCS